MKSDVSLFKFSKITRDDWGIGAAMFTLENMGALARKIERGEDDVILRFIEEVVSAYIMDKGIVPPKADCTRPVDQEST